jgi:hypothetical protein
LESKLSYNSHGETHVASTCMSYEISVTLQGHFLLLLYVRCCFTTPGKKRANVLYGGPRDQRCRIGCGEDDALEPAVRKWLRATVHV